MNNRKTHVQRKVMTGEEAAGLIRNGAVVWLSGGGGGINDPDYLLGCIEARFLREGAPSGLVLYHSAGMGDKMGGGPDHFAHRGMVRRVIGSHWVWSVNMQKLAADEEIEAYVLPQGVMTQLVREAAARRPGLFTKIGLGTFVDPEIEGGRLNRRSADALSEKVCVDGETYIHYKSVRPDVAIFRASEADEAGNVSFVDEGLVTEALSQAQAVKNNGGIVLCQVKRLVERGQVRPYQVIVPGVLIDGIVVDPGQRMSVKTEHSDFMSGRAVGERTQCAPMPLDARKVMARRAAAELKEGDVVNLGFGVPAGVGNVLYECGKEEQVILSLEQGIIGGVPATGTDFGIAFNPQAILCETNQFDWYDGGGLDVAVLSFAEFDRQGNVNVSKFNGKINGVGGFINISQNARKLVFTGTFTASGLVERCGGGRLEILREGAYKKLREQVEQISFSGVYASQAGQEVVFVTERAVFRLENGKIVLIEIAPGVELKRDIFDQMEFVPEISPALKTMDEELFKDD